MDDNNQEGVLVMEDEKGEQEPLIIPFMWTNDIKFGSLHTHR